MRGGEGRGQKLGPRVILPVTERLTWKKDIQSVTRLKMVKTREMSGRTNVQQKSTHILAVCFVFFKQNTIRRLTIKKIKRRCPSMQFFSLFLVCFYTIPECGFVFRLDISIPSFMPKSRQRKRCLSLLSSFHQNDMEACHRHTSKRETHWH